MRYGHRLLPTDRTRHEIAQSLGINHQTDYTMTFSLSFSFSFSLVPPRIATASSNPGIRNTSDPSKSLQVAGQTRKAAALDRQSLAILQIAHHHRPAANFNRPAVTPPNIFTIIKANDEDPFLEPETARSRSGRSDGSSLAHLSGMKPSPLSGELEERISRHSRYEQEPQVGCAAGEIAVLGIGYDVDRIESGSQSDQVALDEYDLGTTERVDDEAVFVHEAAAVKPDCAYQERNTERAAETLADGEWEELDSNGSS